MKRVVIMMITALICELAFTCCSKCDCGEPFDVAMAFCFQRTSGWVNMDENLKINVDTTYYSYHHGLSSVSYQTIATTSEELWDFLIKNFDLKTFKKIKNNCNPDLFDAPVVSFSVITNGETYSFYNGECDEHFIQMQDFFDAIMEQVAVFRDEIK